MEDSPVLDARKAEVSARQKGSPSPVDRAPEVRTLTDFVLRRRMRAALGLLEAQLEDGVPIEGVLSDYLAPAARRLGSLWDADQVTFTDVTVGVGRLQDLQHQLDDRLVPAVAPREAPRVLLATVPGEQHAFGLSMTASLLHRRGWDVSGAPSRRADDLFAAAGTGWYEVIGLSLGCERHLETLDALVERLRASSLNTNVRIAIGGRVAIAQPELLAASLDDQEGAVSITANVETLAALAEAQ